MALIFNWKLGLINVMLGEPQGLRGVQEEDSWWRMPEEG